MLHWQLDCQSVSQSQADPYRLRLIPNIFENEVLGPPLGRGFSLLALSPCR